MDAASLSSSVKPGTGLLVCGYPRLQWPHQDQTSDMTNVLTHSFLPAHNFWATGESVPINQAQNVLYWGNYQWRSYRQKNMQHYCLYQTKPSALGQHLLATRTHSVPFPHTHTDRRSRTDRWIPTEPDWHVARDKNSPKALPEIFFGGDFFLIIYFYRAAPHAHNLTLSKTRSTSMLLLPSNKQQREKESRVAHEYFATKMSQRAPQKSASCNFNYTRAWPHI